MIYSEGDLALCTVEKNRKHDCICQALDRRDRNNNNQ